MRFFEKQPAIFQNFIYTLFIFLSAFSFKAHSESNRLLVNVSNIILIEIKKMNTKK